MKNHIVNSEELAKSFATEIYDLFKQHSYLVINVRPGYQRTVAQKVLECKWIDEIASQDRTMTKEDHRAYFNVTCAYPLLSEEKRKAWKPLLNGASYEAFIQVIAINDIDLTSGFTRDQMSNYLNSIRTYAWDQNFKLTDPKTYDKGN